MLPRVSLFEIIKAALESADATLEDVVRTRVLLTRIDDWEVVAKVRGEYLAVSPKAHTQDFANKPTAFLITNSFEG